MGYNNYQMGYNQQPAFQQQLPSFQEMMNECFGVLHSEMNDMNNNFKIQQEYIESIVEKITELTKEVNDLKKEDSEALIRTQSTFVPTITFESFKLDLHNVVIKFWASELQDISRTIYLNYWYLFLFYYIIYSDLFNFLYKLIIGNLCSNF